MSTEALRELLEAMTTPFPPETAGQQAQTEWGERQTAAVAQARAALAAAPAGGAEPVAVPEGWKLVPVEATPQMLDAAAGASMQHLLDCIADPKKVCDIGSEENVRLTHASRYRKMIAAAPTAQPQPERYVSALDPALRAIKAQPEAPAEPSGTRALLGRWVVFGKAMWKAGSSLPRHLVHDTEALLATPAPAAQQPAELTDAQIDAAAANETGFDVADPGSLQAMSLEEIRRIVRSAIKAQGGSQ